MKKIFPSTLVAFLLLVLCWGCEKKGTPPTLPPAESMIIDFSNFIVSGKSVRISGNSKDVENTNWTVAASVAAVWNSILVLNIAIPVAAFEKAINTTPTNLDKNTWQWKYSVNAIGATYTARLTGQKNTSDVTWDMYISKDGASGYAEFLWYEGTTDLDGKNGSWTIKESQANQVPMLQIDWYKSSSSIDSIKYTYIKAGDAFNSSYIMYGLTSNTLNAFYNVYFWLPNMLKFTNVSIQWSTTVHNGRIEADDYFQDNSWHCWDLNGDDVTCPE
ncbi:MAG: hypothetical protein ABR974_09285 [Bacteroidales bacterium]|jgi:hypothetical protein